MTIPTAPTLGSITAEGIKKAGFTNTTTAQYSAALNRAQSEWMEEIKNDIFNYARGLISLQGEGTIITTPGLAKYAFPADFGMALTVTLLDGDTYGTAQTGTTSSITLAATDTNTDTTLVGKEILIYDGTGKSTYTNNGLSTIIAYNSTTKVATVSPDFGTAPDNTSKYLIVDYYVKLHEVPIWDREAAVNQSAANVPSCYTPMGDSTYGNFLLYPAPYRDSGIPYGVRVRYYADLSMLDLSGNTVWTLYRKWRNVWVQGVMAKCLQANNDDRAQAEMANYLSLLKLMVHSDTYGNLQHEVRCSVGDY